MTPDMVVEIGRGAVETTLLVAAPMLGMSLVIGLLVSLFQALTQINEATLSFVPKILGVFLATMLFFPWMIRVLTGFMTHLLITIPQYAR
ncbi:flagellar biosynthesis protein FliQ [Nitrospira tepida]|uniref:Flagellar biosynthetic protein FliQ n=1 Tax=Nitrospira tepida TaxID=2973512 RepID=A0AA86N1D9_9BACT|nr:flagellar biosynthesis protein FliQ [Nitrospira tepida]